MATMASLEVQVLPGVHLGHRMIQIDRVGRSVPGGRFPLMSAPIMTIVPAVVACVAGIVTCLPPNADPAMIAGCHLSGAHRVFRIGGAQAVAAMAHGTETLSRVAKIVGPGNAFVNEAKRQVFDPVGIEQLSGPPEIFILADETGDADMIASSEEITAEHLEIHTRDAQGLAGRLNNYGSLFIGQNAGVVYSDKCSGTNHRLPTMGAEHYKGGCGSGPMSRSRLING